MKKSASLSISVTPIVIFFKRFHTIIFFLIVSTCLFTAIVILLPITNQPAGQQQPAGQTVDSSFDQATIDKLRSGTSSNSTYQPGERKSPFTE